MDIEEDKLLFITEFKSETRYNVLITMLADYLYLKRDNINANN